MPSPADTLLTKTDAELQFFVDNPQHYQPELVSAARRELARRGTGRPAPPPVYATPAPFAPPPALDFPAEYLDEPARRRPWLVPLLVVVAVLAAALGIYSWLSADRETARALAAREAARLSPDSLKLEEATSAPLPAVDAEQEVARQLAIVPAAELKQVSSQEMRQYRLVGRRFWQAERPTEFLIGMATAGKSPDYPLLISQIRFTEVQWHNSGNDLVYSFHFPPTMADQVARMRTVASIERRVLEHVKDQALQNAPLRLSDKDQSEYATAQELLRGISHRLGTLKGN